MRICSLLPSATEILYAIGLGDSVVGITHECDFPPEVAKKPALIRPRVDPQAPPAEIDRQVNELVARGESIYAVDAKFLVQLAPDLIITQDLCHVCAASPDDLATALARLPNVPQVLSLTPHALADVWNDIRRIGAATGKVECANALASSLEQQLTRIAAKAARRDSHPRVLCLEWLDPYYVGGHWIPEMVSLAGGRDLFGKPGQPSFRITAPQLAESNADVLIVMPCGYGVQRALEEFRSVRPRPELQNLPAFQSGRVFVVDANAFFSRPGPRLAQGVSILSKMFDDQTASASASHAGFCKI
jgi:iron complex transport system substrate-binding protein